MAQVNGSIQVPLTCMWHGAATEYGKSMPAYCMAQSKVNLDAGQAFDFKAHALIMRDVFIYVALPEVRNSSKVWQNGVLGLIYPQVSIAGGCVQLCKPEHCLQYCLAGSQSTCQSNTYRLSNSQSCRRYNTSYARISNLWTTGDIRTEKSARVSWMTSSAAPKTFRLVAIFDKMTVRTVRWSRRPSFSASRTYTCRTLQIHHRMHV